MDEEGERPTKLRKKHNGRSSQGSAGGSRKNRVYVCTGRLPLDEALANLEQDPNNPKVAMRGWSSARVRAYNCIKENPNAYYYRFNAPGESQVNGPWSREERERFLKRLSECGADGNWGIFATKIPGRVGYQCANFYRKLLSEGVVKDSNYYKDSWGKWHYRFSNGEEILQRRELQQRLRMMMMMMINNSNKMRKKMKLRHKMKLLFQRNLTLKVPRRRQRRFVQWKFKTKV